MKGKALFLSVPLALFSIKSGFVAAGENDNSDLVGLPNISPNDLQGIAARLNSLANSPAFQNAAGLLAGTAGGDAELDTQFVQKALGALSSLLTSEDAAALLADLQDNPELAVRKLLGDAAGPDAEAIEAVLMYFFSLRKVLGSNAYLRGQVNDLIQEKADMLLKAGDFGTVLADIAQSAVFSDLREEVEEEMARKGQALPAPDTGDDMSR
ncbi:hypothetical protein Efla_000793 [Eimeria flavescens]